MVSLIFALRSASVHRYDSLTGVPSCQRTVAFEKACVLFNIGALYTQLGARQDRQTARGLDQAVDSFLRAAGTFTYICDNFTNAPSMDLGPHMLQMLVQLMLVSDESSKMYSADPETSTLGWAESGYCQGEPVSQCRHGEAGIDRMSWTVV